jgi:predicted protein tyrosine phosphatase
MNWKRKSAIIVCSLYHLSEIAEQADVLISILGNSDKLLFPDVGNRRVLQLKFDDVSYSSGDFIAPNREQIADLIEFARSWNGSGTLAVHCRAGSPGNRPAGMADLL